MCVFIKYIFLEFVLISGIILAGPPGSGKSSIMQTLVEALCIASAGSKNINEKNHKLLRLYPLVMDDLTELFGSVDNGQNWIDGIFTSSWRKAVRVCVNIF